MALAGFLAAAPVLAEDPKAPSAEDALAADVRFHEGKALLDQGLLKEACDKLAQSLALARKGGTLLNLAVCRQRQGRHASALPLFQEALAAAKAEGRADRAEIAERGALESRGKLGWLVITIAKDAASLGLRASLDGEAIDPTALGSMIAVDPGQHTVTAESPGWSRVSITIESAGAGDRRTVEIPKPAPAPAPKEAVVGAGSPDKAAARGGGTGMLVVGSSLLGVGALATIVGSVMGGVAIADSAESKRLCPGAVCPTDEGYAKNQSARRSATAADVLIPAGLALVASGGAVLLVRGWPAGDAKSQVSVVAAPWVTPFGGGLSAAAAW